METPGGLPSVMYFVVFSTKTAFFKLQDIFPECFFYREQSPQIDPLLCLQEDHACHVGHNCMEVIAKRIHTMFEEVVKGVNVIVLYYRKQTSKGYGAALFWRDMREPRVITMNPFAWSRVKNRGTIYQFAPSSSFYMSGQAPPPEPTSESAGLE